MVSGVLVSGFTDGAFSFSTVGVTIFVVVIAVLNPAILALALVSGILFTLGEVEKTAAPCSCSKYFACSTGILAPL